MWSRCQAGATCPPPHGCASNRVWLHARRTSDERESAVDPGWLGGANAVADGGHELAQTEGVGHGGTMPASAPTPTIVRIPFQRRMLSRVVPMKGSTRYFLTMASPGWRAACQAAAPYCVFPLEYSHRATSASVSPPNSSREPCDSTVPVRITYT